VKEVHPTSHPIDISDYDFAPDGDAPDNDKATDNTIGALK